MTHTAVRPPGSMRPMVDESKTSVRWLQDTLVAVRVTGEDSGEGLTITEHLAGRGSGGPEHSHRHEDETFVILEGELEFTVGDETFRHADAAPVRLPRDVPHTHTVVSPEARFVLLREPAAIELVPPDVKGLWDALAATV